MGKHQHNAQKQKNPSSKSKARQSASEKGSAKFTVILLCSVLLVAALIAGGVFAVQGITDLYADSGRAYRNKEVFRTEHLKVDAAMLSYCFYEYLYENNVLEDLNLKRPEDLKNMGFETGGEDTYHTYYSELTASRMEAALIFAEAALASGQTLDEADQKRIENKLSAIENSAKSAGMKVKDYLSENYGRGIKLSDIRNVLEIRALSDKNMNDVYNAQTVSDEEIRTYISQNDDLKYYRVDYYIYDFVIGNKDTAEENQKLHDEAYAKAELLAACKTEKEFEELCRRLLQEEHKDDSSFTDADLEALVKSCKTTGRAVEKNARGTVDQWLFDFARKEGDTLAVDGEKSVGAVFMIKPAYSVDEPQKAVRVIQLDFDNYLRPSDAVSAMKDLQALFEAGNKTEKAFAELAVQHSEDFLNAPGGGYIADTYTNTVFNRMIASWLSEAQKGDTSSFTSDDSVYFVYCCGEGETRSVTDARNALKSQKYRSVTETYHTRFPDEANMEYVGTIAPLVTG